MTKENILHEDIEEVAMQRYLDYSMSVILGRSIPDVRDGLKPVHRRIIYSMLELGLKYNAAKKKSARVVGHVIGLYHPHSDLATYEAMVRMGQWFVHSNKILDMQGNVGDQDNPKSFCAMRYSETRLGKISTVFTDDLPYNTIDMMKNYDETEMEPTVLPAKFPMFLTNSNIGIAVGYATSCLPYNLNEVCDASIEMIKNDLEITDKKLLSIIKGPDFPTGCTIINRKGINDAILTGHGSIKVRSKTEIKGQKIYIKEIPYLVSKVAFINSIADAAKPRKNGTEVKPGKIPEITNIRDLSDKRQVDIEISVHKDANPEVILNKLYKYTRVQESIKANYIGINNGYPESISFKKAVKIWFDFRFECLIRKHTFLVEKYFKHIEQLEGLLIILNDAEKAIKIIKTAKTVDIAKQSLIKHFKINERQAEYVIEIKVKRFAKSEILKTKELLQDLKDKLEYQQSFLDDTSLVNLEIIEDLEEVKKKFNVDRKTLIQDIPDSDSIDELDLVEKEDSLIYLSKNGFIKRTLKDYSTTQKRGGKGRKIGTGKNDFISNIISCSTHDDIMFITNKGKVHRIKAYGVPEVEIDKIGKHCSGLISMQEGEVVSSIFSVTDYPEDKYLLTVTKKGLIKRTPLSEYERISTAGLITCKLKEDDEVFTCKIVDNEEGNVLLTTSSGKVIHFGMEEVSVVNRTTYGNYGISKELQDDIIGAEVITDLEGRLIFITEDGKGKATEVEEFPVTHRMTKGSIGILTKDDKGIIATFISHNEEDELILTSSGNKTVKISASEVSSLKRRTYGKKLINLDNETVMSAGIIRN